jgi:hypothetical protein
MKAATLINSLAPTNIIFFKYIPLVMLRVSVHTLAGVN